uniref:NADH-ubiquinone oxidoreductase chain 4 n=1 Tax=Asotana magnifica TaxID=2528170 RepID=A0A4P8DNB5_9CRUS|nr:NADH dehydrogenase subunit 4 [Asotana magnifica]
MMSLMWMLGVVIVGGVSYFEGLFYVLLYVFMLYKHDMSWFCGYGGFMFDSLSYVLVLLSIWITMLMIMVMMYDDSVYYKGKLLLCMNVLMGMLVVTFSIVDYIIFYLFFEMCLVPTFVLIIGWGYQSERVNAGMYMMLYTVFASLPLLCLLVFLDYCGCVVSMYLTFKVSMGVMVGYVMFGFCFLAFMVKLPVYVVHLWLPKAHVEAPVGGSMILAGLLLKLGGYGMIRVVNVVGSLGGELLVSMFCWCMYGGLMVGVLCMRQVDVKCLIALSSVAHMSMVVGCVFLQSVWGYNSSLMVMVGHGLCSSGLFCVINMVYKFVGSRSMSVMKGICLIIPAMSLLWFLLCSSNMSAPPSLNLLGEMNGILGIINWSNIFCYILFWLVFFSAGYSLYLYLGVCHGSMSSVVLGGSLCLNDYVVFLMHWLPLNIIIFVDLI